MAMYQYAGTGLDAGWRTGEVLADSPRQARDRLRERGVSVHDLRPMRERGRRWSAGLPGIGTKRRLQAQGAEVVRDLATLLAVGVPVHEAIGLLAEQYRGGLRRVMRLAGEHLESGLSLAEALARAGGHEIRHKGSRERTSGVASGFTSGGGGGLGVLDEVTLSMIAVGEDTGRLDEVLGQVADYLQRRTQFRGKLASALLYPLVVAVTGVGVAVFLMTVVVPDLLAALTETGQALPWPTQVVKGVSDGLVTHGLVVALVLGLLALAGGAACRQRRVRLAVDRWVLRVPGLGGLIRKQAVVRIAFVVSTAMRSGLPFERAIGLARTAVNNRWLRRALADCGASIERGRGIGQGLAETGAFPATVTRVFDLGQESGRLEEVLDRLAVDYDRHVSVAAQRFTTVLEPVMIILLASVIGLIAFATILPILEIGNVL